MQVVGGKGSARQASGEKVKKPAGKKVKGGARQASGGKRKGAVGGASSTSRLVSASAAAAPVASNKQAGAVALIKAYLRIPKPRKTMGEVGPDGFVNTVFPQGEGLLDTTNRFGLLGGLMEEVEEM